MADRPTPISDRLAAWVTALETAALKVRWHEAQGTKWDSFAYMEERRVAQEQADKLPDAFKRIFEEAKPRPRPRGGPRMFTAEDDVPF